jgi:hypothetical protein
MGFLSSNTRAHQWLIKYTDGNAQSFQRINGVSGVFYDRTNTNLNNESMTVFYNNSYRPVSFKDMKSIKIDDYAIIDYYLADVKLTFTMKSGITFKMELAYLYEIYGVQIKDELSKELTTISIKLTKLIHDKRILIIDSIVFK